MFGFETNHSYCSVENIDFQNNMIVITSYYTLCDCVALTKYFLAVIYHNFEISIIILNVLSTKNTY